MRKGFRIFLCKHYMADNKNAEDAEKYICEKCDFKCSKPSNFSMHLATAKHIRLTTCDKNMPEKINMYNCICGIEYKHRQSLYKHKKTCIEIIDLNYKNKIIEELMKQNQELKELIIEQKELIIEQKEDKHEMKEVLLVQCEQGKYLIELAKDQAEEQQTHNKKVLELAQEQKECQKELMAQIKEKGLGTTNNITNNHNQFNLNFFLNDTCKDAMNIEELYLFFTNYEITYKMVESFEKLNHVTGMGNVFNTIMNDVPVNKRPIHCSDVKREVIHIKQNDQWEKEKEIVEPLERLLLRYLRDIVFNKMVKWQQNILDTNNNDQDEDRYEKVFMHIVAYTCDEVINDKLKTMVAKRMCVVKSGMELVS